MTYEQIKLMRTVGSILAELADSEKSQSKLLRLNSASWYLLQLMDTMMTKPNAERVTA